MSQASQAKSKSTSNKKGKGKKKKANFKALPAETLEAVEEALGMCWDPEDLSLRMVGFFDAPCLVGHEVPDGWYAPRHVHTTAGLCAGIHVCPGYLGQTLRFATLW